MYWLLTRGAERYRVLHPADDCRADLGEKVVELPDPATARSFLDWVGAYPGDLDVLRPLLHVDLAPFDISRLDDQEVRELLAQRLACGLLRVAVSSCRLAADVGVAKEPEVARSSQPPVKETTWVEFVVLDDATGDPVPNAKLSITLPGRAKADHTTPESGSLDFDGCKPGTCEITVDLAGATLGSTLELVGIGYPSGEPLRGVVLPTEGNKPFRLARITRHRVRAGDTIANLAERAGMGWKDLARFNFDTDMPEEVNKALRTQVGCTRKSRGGKNYVLDGSDDPGIIYIPQQIELRGISTGQTHRLCVRRIAMRQRPFVFSC